MLVNRLFWKRTCFFVDYTREYQGKIALRNIESGQVVYFETKPLSDCQFRAKLNIVIANGRNLLEEGRWELIDGETNNVIKSFETIIFENLDKCQRVFKYSGRFYTNIYFLENIDNSIIINNMFFRNIRCNNTIKKFINSFSCEKALISYPKENKISATENASCGDEEIIIDDLEWNCNELILFYNSKQKVNVCFFNEQEKRAINIDSTFNDGVGIIKIPIIDLEKKSIWEKGSWSLCIEETLKVIPLAESVMLRIEEHNRTFFNKQRKQAITICTLLDSNKHSDIPGLIIEVSYVTLINSKSTNSITSAIIESYSIKQFIKKLFFVVTKAILNSIYKISLLLHKHDGKNVLLMAENRPQLAGNLKALADRLKERKIDEDFDISYSCRNVFSKKENPLLWPKMAMKIAKQDFIFVDDYTPIFNFIDLSPKTTLVQLWHAGCGFKLVGYARFGIQGSPHPIKSCHRKYTYGVVGNEHLKEIYSEVFGIEKDALLPTGMLRLSNILDEDIRKKFTEAFYNNNPQFVGKTIITFAPTYRGDGQREAYYDFDELDFDKLYEYCKDNNAVFIVKQHHFLREKAPIKKEQMDVFYELSEYDLNDLFYVTDILITDYSSCFYDYLLFDKPILFFMYDKAIYEATRGVQRSIDKFAPGKICNNFDELLLALENKDYGGKQASEFFKDKCITNTTTACDKIIDFVLYGENVEM